MSDCGCEWAGPDLTLICAQHHADDLRDARQEEQTTASMRQSMIFDIEKALIGTEMGGFLPDEANVPVGELRRLLREEWATRNGSRPPLHSVDVQMDRPLPPDWGGEESESGSLLYHSAWDSTDEDLRLWVGPYKGEVDTGWAVTVSASNVDITMQADPDRIVEWAGEIVAAIRQSRDEAADVAAEADR